MISLYNWIKYIRYRKNNIYISHSAIVTKCKFEKKGYNRIGRKTRLDSCEIGVGTYLGENCKFKNSKIGKYCSIGSDVALAYGEHPTHKFVSLHPAFYKNSDIAGLNFHNETDFVSYKYVDGFYAVIGNDVWIGDGVVLINGVRVGDGSIIGAGAVVAKDVPPYSIVVGNPAKVVKYRFDQSEIEKMLNVRWWDKEQSWIKDNIMLFNDIENFLKGVVDD